ncbi:MAG: hypothetical protein U0570_03725 [Phycisphaerales bacterium]
MTRLLLLLPFLFLTACASSGPSFLGGTPNPGGWPFVPTSMRIFPLTHIERGSPPPAPPANPTGPSPADNIPPQDVTPPPASVRIITHLEFRDAWGDSTKAIGQLVILLYGPGGRPASSSASDDIQQGRYEIDLSDLKRNAELYDPATRTYRIPLAGLPSWITQPGATPRITLRAEVKAPRADGTSVMMVDEYTLAR